MAKAKAARQGKDSKYTHLIKQASECLNAYGVSHTSLTDVASRLGVSREALYYYVKDKEDLVFKCYLNSCSLLSNGLNLAVAEKEDAFEIIDAFVTNVLDERKDEFAAISEPYCLNSKQRSIIIESCFELKQRLAEIIEAGIASGKVRPCEPGVIALAILGMVSWVPTAQRWRSNISLSRQEIVQATREIISLGIAQNRQETVDYQWSQVTVSGMPTRNIFDSGALAAARKDAILAAASWMFNLKGFGATSLDEIAERIGVTKKVIYHNIGNKEKLLVSCYKRTFEFYERTIESLINLRDQPLKFICSATLIFTEAGMREDLALLVSVTGLDALPAPIMNEINDSSERLMDYYLNAFARAQKQGLIRQFNSRAVIASHASVFQWMPKWHELLTEEERKVTAKEIVDLVRIGLRPTAVQEASWAGDEAGKTTLLP